MSHPALTRTLKTHGRSLTAVRSQIYEYLASHEPLTMQELVRALPRVNRASIYRTIVLFEQLGIVQRLQIGWKYKLELSNNYQEHHHHATCSVCGSTVALPEDALLENRLTELARSLAFSPEDHQIEVRGRCQKCRKKLTIS